MSQRDSHSFQSFTHAYPRTPYPTIPETEEWSAPPFEIWNNAVDMTENGAERSARRYFNDPPCHSPLTPSSNISSAELRKVLDSLLDQVDWLEVAVKVARNRAPSIYCNAIEKILLAYIDQLAKTEDEDSDTAQVETGIGDKSSMITYASDDDEGDRDGSDFVIDSEDEEGDSDGSDFVMESEDEEGDGDNSEDMEEDRDKYNEANNDIYDEDSD